jgi:hypothetical protein
MRQINQQREAVLVEWLRRKAAEALQAGEPMFMGIPDTWFETHRHLCNNGHISAMYCKSEALGGCVCLECSQPSHLCPPGLTETELQTILNTLSNETV